MSLCDYIVWCVDVDIGRRQELNVALNPPPYHKLYSAEGAGPPPPPPPGPARDHELRAFSWAMNSVTVDLSPVDFRDIAQQ